jgi:hypothetical protein
VAVFEFVAVAVFEFVAVAVSEFVSMAVSVFEFVAVAVAVFEFLSDWRQGASGRGAVACSCAFGAFGVGRRILAAAAADEEREAG